MLDYLAQPVLPNESFIYERIGEEAKIIRRSLIQSEGAGQDLPKSMRKFNKIYLSEILKKMRREILHWLLGAEGMRALEIGEFRLAGEVHHQITAARRPRASDLGMSAAFPPIAKYDNIIASMERPRPQTRHPLGKRLNRKRCGRGISRLASGGMSAAGGPPSTGLSCQSAQAG